MDGCITQQQFHSCCQQIIHRSTTLFDNFQLQQHQQNKYLVKKSTRILENPQIQPTRDEHDPPEDEDETADVDELAVSTAPVESVSYEHHIIYSESYNVPVMYFQASDDSGKMLSLQQLWDLVPECHRHALRERWSFVSQQEHPYLLRPFYYLHPCHTQVLMKSLHCGGGGCGGGGGSQGNYVLMWLSAIADVVGLKLSLDYFT